MPMLSHYIDMYILDQTSHRVAQISHCITVFAYQTMKQDMLHVYIVC